ncbi:MAG: dTDP-4-dehydrorhamnose 3,5-epimerase family protein [Patescibacteria group bacterium]
MHSTHTSEPLFIEGGLAVDDRGSITFANDFDFAQVKRFYMVENVSTEVVRAYHGHAKEAKYALIASGSAIVVAVAMDDTRAPSKENKVHRYVLSSKKPGVLYIPAGFVNGFRALEPQTRILFFSTSTLEESKGDDFRFPTDYWGSELWNVENR